MEINSCVKWEESESWFWERRTGHFYEPSNGFLDELANNVEEECCGFTLANHTGRQCEQGGGIDLGLSRLSSHNLCTRPFPTDIEIEKMKHVDTDEFLAIPV